MKRKIFIIAIAILICGSILTTILIFKSSKDKETVISQMNNTSQSSVDESSITTPTPTVSPVPSNEPTPSAVETNTGEILFQKNIDLDGDNIDEEISINKVIDLSENKQYEGVLRIKSDEVTKRIPFIKRVENNQIGVFNSIEFADLDNDSYKDIFISIPDTKTEFGTSYFFAYNFKKQKEFDYNLNNMDFINNLINGFKFNYSGRGILDIVNNLYNFKSGINIMNSSNFSDSEETNKSQYDKTWIESPPVEVDQNFKLILNNNKNQIEIKIPLPIFGQSASDILGEIDSYFIFSNDFKPILKRLELQQFNGNDKKMVVSKDIQ